MICLPYRRIKAVQACTTPTDELLIARITPLEFRSAFFGLVRQGLLSPADAQNYIQAFDSDLAQYVVIPADEAVFLKTPVVQRFDPFRLRCLSSFWQASNQNSLCSTFFRADRFAKIDARLPYGQCQNRSIINLSKSPGAADNALTNAHRVGRLAGSLLLLPPSLCSEVTLLSPMARLPAPEDENLSNLKGIEGSHPWLEKDAWYSA